MDLGTQWHFSRPKLVAELADQLAGHQRIAMFGERQTGKTTLMREELMPELERRGLLPVYIECWADRGDPMGSINHALAKALEQVQFTPASTLGRLAKTPVKKISVFGLTVDLGELGQRTLPERPTLRFDALLTVLLEASNKDVVLLFDEFQAIASTKEADTLSAGIRAALAQASKRVGVIFSGSNPSELLLMFTTSRAPLFGFADTHPYPVLREDFVGHVVQKFKLATTRDLNHALALHLLERCGHQPAPFLKVISMMLGDPELSIDTALRALLSRQHRSPWSVAWDSLTPVQQLTLRLVMAGAALTSLASREWMQAELDKVQPDPGLEPARGKSKEAEKPNSTDTGAAGTASSAQAVAGSTVARAIEALESKGIIARAKAWTVVDPVMRLWLQENVAVVA